MAEKQTGKQPFYFVLREIERTLRDAGVPFDWENEETLNGFTVFRLRENGLPETGCGAELIPEAVPDFRRRLMNEGGENAFRKSLETALANGNFFFFRGNENIPHSLVLSQGSAGQFQVCAGGVPPEMAEPRPLKLYKSLLNGLFGLFRKEAEEYGRKRAAYDTYRRNQESFRTYFEAKAAARNGLPAEPFRSGAMRKPPASP